MRKSENWWMQKCANDEKNIAQNSQFSLSSYISIQALLVKWGGPSLFSRREIICFFFFSIKSKARRRSILFYFSQKLWDRLTGLEISGHKGHKSMAKKKPRKRQDFYEVAWLANKLCVKGKVVRKLAVSAMFDQHLRSAKV